MCLGRCQLAASPASPSTAAWLSDYKRPPTRGLMSVARGVRPPEPCKRELRRLRSAVAWAAYFDAARPAAFATARTARGSPEACRHGRLGSARTPVGARRSLGSAPRRRRDADV